MKLDKIADLLFELEDVNSQIYDLEAYASLVIENNLNTTVEFTFSSEKKKDEEKEPEGPVFMGIMAFFETSTSSYKPKNDDEYSMVTSINQATMLRMFGLLMEDLSKKKKSLLTRLKKLGVYEGATDTSKED